VDSRTQAEALRGTRLYVAREALPAPAPGEYYHVDLIGLDVVTADGTELGRVRTYEDHGAGAYLELDADGPDGPICIPFTPDTCAVDLGSGKVRVTVPEGLLDPAPKPEVAEGEVAPEANPRRRRGPVRWRRRRS
jgi:16S rRNA processing protein RimM